MAKVPSIPKALNLLFPPEWLRHLAIELGVVQRQGKVDIVVFFWALILAPVAGMAHSLTAMRRMFELMGAITIAPSAYQKRFSLDLVQMLRCCAERAFSQAENPLMSPKLFRYFSDVIAIDSSLVKLADALSSLYPGTRKKSAPAMAKVNAAYSVISGSLRRLSISAGKTAEVKVLKLDRCLDGILLLFDLGYFKYQVFHTIVRRKGFFISRMKKNANPLIVQDRYAGPGRTRPLVGLRLWDAIDKLGRQELDVDVKVTYRQNRRPTPNDPRKTKQHTVRLRVVGVRHPETGEFHVYLTNLAPEQMTPEQIRIAYTARWYVELIFDALKNDCGMKEFPSARPEVVESLIYLAAIRLAVSRLAMSTLRSRISRQAQSEHPAVAQAIERALDQRTSPRQFLKTWNAFALLLLPDVLKEAGIPWDPGMLERLLAVSMIDPMHRRDTLLSRLVAA